MDATFSTVPAPHSFDPSDAFLDRLLHPGGFFVHPRDVLRDDTLDRQEKRAILSSWASDACAVDSLPALRRPPGAPEPVTFDSIMEALRSLDDGELADPLAGQRPAGSIADTDIHIF